MPEGTEASAKRYRSYLLSLLTLIFLFNYVDRVALGVLLQDIKTDLSLTDTQLGFLSGIAFALFYSVMGVPIARWADRGNRVAIISVTATLWSIAVALCGTAGSFVQLLAIRVGVAVGEAGCAPPALSLIADYFNRAERPRANAIYSLGGALSTIVGFFLAGWLRELYGWRATFVLLGMPGLPLAALAWFTLREPRKIGVPVRAEPPALQPGLVEIGRKLWGIGTFRHLLMCLSVVLFFFYGVLQWQPSFFIRSYGFTTGVLGAWLAVTYGSGYLIGTYLGGEMCSRYAIHNERLQLRMMAVCIGLAGILSVFVYLSSNPYVAFGLLAISFVGLGVLNGPFFAAIQTLVPERMRAVSFAFVYLVANLVGMGLGPLLVGALSDSLRPWAGQESLRYALLLMSPGYLWAAWHSWRASQTASHDIRAANLQDDIGADRLVAPVRLLKAHE